MKLGMNMKKIHIVEQHDMRDCGAACLSMISWYYGLKLPISKFRDLTKTDKSGTNLYGIVDGASKIGLKAEALNGNIEELNEGISSNDIKFPFIAHIVDDNAVLHYVVVFGIKNDKFIIGDPARGKIRIKKDFFNEIWTGYIITFQKEENFKKGNYTKGSFLKFFSLLKGQYLKLGLVIVLSLVIAICGILGAYVFEIIIDNFNMVDISTEISEEDECSDPTHDHSEDEDIGHTENTEDAEMTDVSIIEELFVIFTDGMSKYNINAVFALIIGLYILQAIIQFLRGCLITSLSKKIDIRLSLSYYNHIADLPMSSISVRQTGEYLSRFSDASTIRMAISGATLTLLIDSFMVVASGVILFLENSKLFFVSLLVVLAYAIVVLLYRKPVDRINRTTMENNAKLQSFFKESIDGIETVKASSATEQIKNSTTNKFTKFINSVVKGSLISLSQDAIADAIELIGAAVVLWLGFSMALSGNITIGSLLTFYTLLAYFSQPIKNLIELQPTIQTALVAAERLNDILDIQKENVENSDTNLNSINNLEIKDVCFRYGNRKPTLKNINISVKKGQKIAIVGESGSGKTTLAKLLLRFYEPESGNILIDKKDIKDFNLISLRDNIAYVSQNTFMFSDTIENNLKLGNCDVTDEEIKKACKISKADSFIENLPLGYNTPLDENGVNLSGGQRQRLAIARALLRKPQLLILDEATSNLDTITEAGIKNTVFEINKDMTCIIIAHRLSTVKNCDCIYVMENGEIIEFGSHKELLSKNSKYLELWNMQ